MIFPRKFACQVELICFLFVHVSGRRQFKRGMCKELYFLIFVACLNQSCFCMSCFQKNLTNDSDVKHSFFDVSEALAYAKHRFEVKHCIDVEHSCVLFLHVQSCLHVQLILHWTDVDRVGQKYVFVCSVLDTECKSEQCLQN